MQKLKTIISIAVMFMFLMQAVPVFAYTDIAEDSPYFQAIENLTKLNIFQGYEDGTFKPEQEVNRAEALKIILKSAGIQVQNGLYSTGFPDVPIDAWYAGYVMEGLSKNIINGNADGTFAGARTVNTAEFLKITLLAFNIDLSKHQNLTTPVASDVGISDWYSSYLSYAKTVGIIYPDMGLKLNPSKNLNRGECAQIIYKMYLLQLGGETQKLLSIAEAGLVEALIHISVNNIEGAIIKAEEAVYYSDLALKADPESNTTSATYKIALAFQKLFYAYREGLSNNESQVITLTTEAKDLASQAVSENPTSSFFAEKVNQQADLLIAQLLE